MYVWKSVFLVKSVCDFGGGIGENRIKLLMNEVGFFDWVICGDVVFVLKFRNAYVF